jgi:phage terminase small subunit
MALSNRQRVFIEEYLKCWVGSEAARRAGYANERVAAVRLLTKDNIKAIIQERISEKAMTADEVLTRLAEHARGDMGDFMDISSMAFGLNLNKANELGLTRLIHKIKQRTVTHIDKEGEEEETNTIEFELYDAQSALVQLGKHHELFTDNTDITSGGQLIKVIGIGINTDAL